MALLHAGVGAADPAAEEAAVAEDAELPLRGVGTALDPIVARRNSLTAELKLLR
jgi:hypothetical protein